MSSVRSRVAVLAAITLPVLCQPALAADAKRPAPAAAKLQPEPSGSELVGKLLKEQSGPSDPDVPLPQRGLSLTQTTPSTPLDGPQLFGRQEEGGAVMGLKFPIRVTRGTN